MTLGHGVLGRVHCTGLARPATIAPEHWIGAQHRGNRQVVGIGTDVYVCVGVDGAVVLRRKQNLR